MKMREMLFFWKTFPAESDRCRLDAKASINNEAGADRW